MVKKTKGGKVMNPTDAYRKELRKKELKRNKKERKKVREVGILKKDPEQIRDQIQKLEMMKAEGALDKARKHKKRQLEDTLNVVLKKRKEYEEKMKEKGEAPVMFSHLGPPRRRTEEDEGANHPKPEDSVYYHPTLNPTGAPPPGKPPMYKSSIGPRIPLSEASSSSDPVLTSDLDNGTLPVPPPPPLPKTDDGESGDALITPESLPLPPPPPMPPSSGLALSLPPPPPPPPGPVPKDQYDMRPPLQQPPPPGTIGAERESNQSLAMDGLSSNEANQVPSILPSRPPRPPGLLHPLTGHLPDSMVSKSDTKTISENTDLSKMSSLLPPPPPRQPTPMTGPGTISSIQSDVFPPGISRVLPPPPGPEMLPQTAHAAGLPGSAVAPTGMVPIMPRPPFGPLPGPPPMMRPPLPPGPPPAFHLEDHFGARPTVPQKPSYVKSAAPTVVKRPLAQHTPELTAMVPASVRVRRESVLPKQKLKSTLANPAITSQPSFSATSMKAPTHSTSSSIQPKGQSIDDSYSAFLEDMKALGALDR